MLSRSFGTIACLGMFLICGCKAPPPPIVEAGGVILLNGEPLPNAKVMFFPQFENSNDFIAQGVTDEKGHFTLTCKGMPGACAVENIVSVRDEDVPTELTSPGARNELIAYRNNLKNRPIPSIYNNPSSSTIRVTISAQQKEYKIELKR